MSNAKIKLAAVTGVTSGFGRAIAERLIADGASVIGFGRRAERLQELSGKLGARFRGVALDVRDQLAVNETFANLPEGFRDLDVLVNNAGLALGLEPFQKGLLENWDQMIETNINGLVYCTRAVLSGMIERGRGHVINLGSVAGEFPYPGGNVYGATKAFVRQLSLNLRADLLGTPVRVTDIEPGLCGGTEFSEVRFKGDAKKAADVYRGTEPLTARDIAETVSWIVHLPSHMNVNTISLMPVCQSFGPLAIDRS